MLDRFINKSIVLVSPLRPAWSTGIDGAGDGGLTGFAWTAESIVRAAVWFLALWAGLTFCRFLFCLVGKRFGFLSIDAWWVILPWRWLKRLWDEHIGAWLDEGDISVKVRGRFAGMFTCFRRLYRPGDLFLGVVRVFRLSGYQPVGLRDPQRGVIVFAEPGAGKTQWLISLLATHLGPCMSFDPDGTITRVLWRRLGVGGAGIVAKLTKAGKAMRFACLDPKGLSGLASSAWCALDEITRACERHGSDAAIWMCEKIAEALVRQTDNHQPVFADVSRRFIEGLVLLVWLVFTDRCNLITVRQLLTQGWRQACKPGEDPWLVLLDFMIEIDLEAVGKLNPHGLFPDGKLPEEYGDKIRSAGSLMKSGESRDGKNPFRTPAIDQMSFLDDPGIRRISRHSDFELAELKEDLNLTVVAPVGDMRTTFSGYFRLLTILNFTVFENTRPGKELFLCCLEENPALGVIERLPVIVSNCRKLSMRVVIINQDRGQIDHLYKEQSETLISSSEAEIYMGTGHTGTQRYLSTKLGKATQIEKIDGPWMSSAPERYQKVDREVATAEDLDRLLNPRRRNIIVKISSVRAMILKQGRYTEVLPVWYYQPDPNYRERWERRLTRRIVRRVLENRRSPEMKWGEALDLMGLEDAPCVVDIEVSYQLRMASLRRDRKALARLNAARSLLLRETGKKEKVYVFGD